ncbi:MAG: GNAT family N-acetyltransferase [Chloracidobacterium sp.]|nr:GNAT family N-acetyltransferase [Chloracidobacterium sp.]
MRLKMRHAGIGDLPTVVRMLADDSLGAGRENLSEPLSENYLNAFREIEADPNNELIVAELDGTVVGTLQLTFTPSISFQGGKRSTVESVRVDEKHRGKGFGREMMIWAIEQAREKGCVSMQLTSHSSRERAHAFYETLGFARSHVGMKLRLK